MNKILSLILIVPLVMGCANHKKTSVELPDRGICAHRGAMDTLPENTIAAFEEAVTVYGNEIYAYKIRENYLTLEGADDTVDIDNVIITPNLGRIIAISEQYGVEAGTGGNVDWHTGSIALTASVQDYNLEAWATENIPNYRNHDIEIMRVFYEAPPAILRYFDPLKYFPDSISL